MSTSNFPVRGLTDTDRYLLKRAAAELGISANQFALDTLRAKLDDLLPGVRTMYDNRQALVEKTLRRQGVDPESPQYQAERARARAELARIDLLGKGKSA